MEFDEWIGESRMLKSLREDADRLRVVSLLIEEYFQQLRDIIEAFLVVQPFNLTSDNRSSYRGFIRGKIPEFVQLAACGNFFVQSSYFPISSW